MGAVSRAPRPRWSCRRDTALFADFLPVHVLALLGRLRGRGRLRHLWRRRFARSWWGRRLRRRRPVDILVMLHVLVMLQVALLWMLHVSLVVMFLAALRRRNTALPLDISLRGGAAGLRIALLVRDGLRLDALRLAARAALLMLEVL